MWREYEQKRENNKSIYKIVKFKLLTIKLVQQNLENFSIEIF